MIDIPTEHTSLTHVPTIIETSIKISDETDELKMNESLLELDEIIEINTTQTIDSLIKYLFWNVHDFILYFFLNSDNNALIQEQKEISKEILELKFNLSSRDQLVFFYKQYQY